MSKDRLTFYSSVESNPGPSDHIWALFVGNELYTALLPCQFCDVRVQVTGKLERDGDNAIMTLDDDSKDAYPNHLKTHQEIAP